ncbi:hypothetical protein AAVH_41050, partial [Aphelenchoides avenae]
QDKLAKESVRKKSLWQRMQRGMSGVVPGGVIPAPRPQVTPYSLFPFVGLANDAAGVSTLNAVNTRLGRTDSLSMQMKTLREKSASRPSSYCI